MSRLLVPAVVLCAAVAAVAGRPSHAPDADPVAPAPETTPEDPFPIRRLRATEAQLRDVRGQLEPGPLVRLPRDEFEDRVRAAGRAAAEAKTPPRIAETRYRAALVVGDLVGSAEFELTNGGSGSHFVPLDPLKLALAPATWADGREAVVGVPAGGAVAGVWVDRPGRQTVKFGWSLAGVTEPGERRFELRVPPAPAAVLDLELPTGQVPAVAAAEALLTGPFPVPGDPSRAGWRVRFGGRSRLDLAVRPAGNPGVAAAATLVARYELGQGHLACAFEYDLRPAKGTVGEWAFTLDPDLRVADVVVNNRAGWVVDPPTGPDAPRRLRVTLRQPGLGGKVLVSAVAPWPVAGPVAPLPAVRPVGAVVEDERVEIHLAPGARITNWNPGDYRLTDTQSAADQGRVLTLVGTLLPPGADRPFRRPPAVQVAAGEAEFATTEQVAWRLDGDRVSATVRVGLRVRRGPVFGLSLRVPAGYTFAGVGAAPEDLVSSAGVSGGVVTVEFARPTGAGYGTELTFEFRGPALPPGRHRLPFPAFVPLGAVERVGVLGVYSGLGWVTDLRPGPGTTRTGWLDPFDPPLPPGAAAAFRYRAGDPSGWAELTPARVEFTARAATVVTGSPPDRTAVTTVAIDVRAGSLPAVLALGDRAAVNRVWRVAAGGNAIASATSVPSAVLARPCGPPALALPPVLWVVRFVRPETADLTLETSASVPSAGDPGRTGRVTLVGAEDAGPVVVPPPGPGPLPAPARVWAFSDLYLITAVASRGEAEVVFGGAIAASGGPALPVGLPGGAEVRSASVGGRWVDPGALRVSSDRALLLPVPAETPVGFEVRYRLRTDPGGLITRVRSPEPALPAGGAGVRRWWVFGPDVAPGWPVRTWGRVSSSDLPPLAGGPVDGVVYRSPDCEVRVAGTRLAGAVGVFAAVVLLALALASARRRHPVCGLLVSVGLLPVGVAALLGPPWWQHAAAVPLVVGLVSAGAMVVARGHGSRLPAAAVLVVAACGLVQPETVAQTPPGATVVILPADAEGRETVVAANATLDRLAAAARPQSPGVVLTSADFAIAVEDSTARVTAKFTVHAVGEAEPVATLPLADARLEQVTVGGAAAHPASPRPGVYTVPLPGPGRHQVEVRFVVPVGGTGPEREVRFGVPDGPALKVVADLPAGAKQARVVGRVGRQSVTARGRVRVEADAGDPEAVLVRWRDGSGGAAAVKVREACVWDVSEGGARLTACYLVTVGQGTVSSLRFDVPAELDPLDVTAVRRYDESPKVAPPAGTPRTPDPGGTPVGVRDWSVGAAADGFRPLRIDFHAPTAGQVLVTLALAPRQAGNRQPLLRFPRVGGVAPASADPDAAYGLRARGVVVEALTQTGTIDFSPDALTRDREFAKVLRLDPNTPVRVFRPVTAGAAELRPTLRLAADPPAVTLDTIWHPGQSRADAAGTVRWAGKDTRALLEFTLPGVRVTEVRGADVAWWAQPGGRVQVWLRQAAREGEVAWSGTVAAPASPFDAVTPRVSDGRLAADTVRLRPAEGFVAAVERGRGWADAETPGDPLSFRTTTPAAPPLRVRVSPAPPVLRPDELGWLAPSPRRLARPTPPPVPEVPGAATGTPAAPPPADPVRWVRPVSAAVVWCAAVGLLAVLLARFPGSTWPEQFGLTGGLFGVAVAGGWWVGPVAWVAARFVWAVTLYRRPRAAPAPDALR